MLTRTLLALYGLVSYLLFLLSFLYAIGFVVNLGVPTTLDGPVRTTPALATTMDLGLLALFAVQHSVMARRGFKAWLTRYLPAAIERSTYVLASTAALMVLMLYWQPLPLVIWSVPDGLLATLLTALGAAGWLLVLLSTYLINHFDLFGLRQVWLHWRGLPYRPLEFGTPSLYRYVRHPLYLGWLLAFWCTPRMGAAHLLFAIGTTAYILFAIRLEERDLIHYLGDAYREYRDRVPMLFPRLRASKPLRSP